MDQQQQQQCNNKTQKQLSPCKWNTLYINEFLDSSGHSIHISYKMFYSLFQSFGKMKFFQIFARINMEKNVLQKYLVEGFPNIDLVIGWCCMFLESYRFR